MKTDAPVNSYIVRVYRREKGNPRLLVGIVEEPGMKERKAFANLEELWDILNRRKVSTCGIARKG